MAAMQYCPACKAYSFSFICPRCKGDLVDPPVFPPPPKPVRDECSHPSEPIMVKVMVCDEYTTPVCKHCGQEIRT